MRRLAALAAEAGVEIREHTRVESLEELRGATVVVCTDGYPGGLLGEIEGLIIPTRGQVIATEPVPEQFFEVPALRSPRLRLLAPGRRMGASLRVASGT